MDVDKEFREAVQNVSRKSAQDVRFTPELEKRINDQLAKRRLKGYRRLYTAGAVAASIALAFAVWKPISSLLPNDLQQAAAELSGQKAKALVQKALQPLQKAIPELGGYQLTVKDVASGVIMAELRKSDNEYVQVAVSTGTEQLEMFKWFTSDAGKQALPEQAAKEKANAFLDALLGEQRKQYEQVAAGEIYRPQNGFLELDVNGTYVTYKQLKDGKAVPFGDITLWVDGAGRVVAYGQLNSEEQATLDKLAKALPEFKPEAVLVNKDKRKDGSFLMLANADEQGSTVLISTKGSGDAVWHYRVDAPRGEGWERAPKALASEKASQFLQSVLGEDWKNYREKESSDIPRYQRYHNGLPVLGDDLYVVVDKTGHVTDFAKNAASYDLAALPDPSTAVSKEEAEKEVAANMKLRYIERLFERAPEPKRKNLGPLLDYTPAVAFYQMGQSRSIYWYIDAETGKIQYGTGNNGMEYDGLAANEPISLTPPKQAVAIKTKEAATAMLTEEWGVDLKGLSYSEREQEKREGEGKEKVFHWETKEGKRLEVAVDAATGQVVDVSIPRKDTNISVSEQAAFKEAIRVLEKYVDPGVAEVQVSQIIKPGEASPVTSGDWQFEFIKSHDGVPVLQQYPDEAYIVTVDPSTGKANGFLNRTESAEAVALPDKSKAVPVEQAVREYLAYMPLQLAYTIKGVRDEELAKPKLVYVPMSGKEYADKYIYIDAISGKAVIR
ncbi:YcdB/YcdC domain-containing protein [Brevibacillus borstelensis]|uniref:YcdB/YcdC domain-containing protein n=1 Tax=Brevibacillus borstelensis TaxID=45462 RepID=UPI0030BBD982